MTMTGQLGVFLRALEEMMVRSGRTFLCQWVRSMIYLYTGFLLDWMCVLFSLLSSDREFMKQPVESNQDPTTLGSC